VLVVLQPQTGATFIKVVQRVVGTVLGGVIAAGIAWAVHDMLGILAVVFILAAVSVALLPVNYAAFSIFLTPTFVLLAEVNAGDWHLAHLRILNTLLGGVLALVGARLLWPDAGRARVEQQIAVAIQALRDYLTKIAEYERSRGDESAARDINEARRAVGLAVLNADAAFQWRLGEVGAATSALEPLMAALTYTRRASAAATALTWTGPASASAESSGAVGAFARGAAAALDDMANALTEERAAADLPPGLESGVAGPELPSDPLLAAQLARAGRQLATLHGAVRRVVGAPEPARAPQQPATREAVTSG
jgi:uncharacterized membrane protein YccC